MARACTSRGATTGTEWDTCNDCLASHADWISYPHREIRREVTR
jgi:hypothetical protein